MIDLKHVRSRTMAIIFALTMSLVCCGISSVNAQSNARGMNDATKHKEIVKRDPFWPVGYTPTSPDEEMARKLEEARKAAAKLDWNAAMKMIVINGVSSRADDEYFAVINGEVKSTGDTVVVNHKGSVYTWAVESIKPPGSVKLRRVKAE